MMESSIERIVPDMTATKEITGNESLQLHLERYHFAGKHLLKGTVADIACGAGYGSYILATQYAEKALKIVAADINEEIINYAKLKYAHSAISFLQGDITQFILQTQLQNIVCLETLEHLPDPYSFVRHISKYLQSNGLFIASVPITPSMDANPFHLHDFTLNSFRKMFADAGFRETTTMQQVQPYKIGDVLLKKEKRVINSRGRLPAYYASHPNKFFLRLRSILTDGFCNKYIVAVFQKL